MLCMTHKHAQRNEDKGGVGWCVVRVESDRKGRQEGQQCKHTPPFLVETIYRMLLGVTGNHAVRICVEWTQNLQIWVSTPHCDL